MCLNSVAMPLLSSGIFGYPKRRAAAVVLSSIFEYYEKRDLAAPAESVKGRLPDTVECNLAASAVPRFVTLMDVDREAFDALVTEMRKFAKFQSSFRRTEL
jgi:O-acetyl-ADP-ribose deacetylase (regulator of RNase III)